jgi:hypothetical protein
MEIIEKIKIFIFNTLQLIFTSIISVLKMAFGHSDSHTALSSNYCFSQKSAGKSDGSKLFIHIIFIK